MRSTIRVFYEKYYYYYAYMIITVASLSVCGICCVHY